MSLCLRALTNHFFLLSAILYYCWLHLCVYVFTLLPGGSHRTSFHHCVSEHSASLFHPAKRKQNKFRARAIFPWMSILPTRFCSAWIFSPLSSDFQCACDFHHPFYLLTCELRAWEKEQACCGFPSANAGLPVWTEPRTSTYPGKKKEERNAVTCPVGPVTWGWGGPDRIYQYHCWHFSFLFQCLLF